MSMSRRMILIFFLMILTIVAINAYYCSITNIAASDDYTSGRFRNMASNMIHNTEQYITMMDLAIDDLVSDVNFLESFYQISQFGDTDPAAAQTWQNKMSYTLYHSASAGNFYRVSIYSGNGYYLSNHIDRNDSLVSMSDEAQEIIGSIPYLPQVQRTPYLRHIIGPHQDYFTLNRDVSVFSIVRSISLHGKHVGFIEVSSEARELESLFVTDSDSVMTYAVFDDGCVFYDTGDAGAEYRDIPLDAFQPSVVDNGVKLDLYHAQSRWLGLDLYVSQYSSVRISTIAGLVVKYLRYSAAVAVVALVMVVLVSMNMTRSIRRLTDKVRMTSARKLLKENNPIVVNTFVTSAKDAELYDLEQRFNTLMADLQAANRNEIAMRENTTNARLNALQAQINPHFVYNTLNIIAAKGMESGNEDVVDLCAQFAEMLRYSTDTRSKSVLLQEDVEHVTNYLMLLKARYEDGLEYTIDIPSEMRNIKIPRLTLQPLVENSIVHGFNDGTEVRRISIQGSLQNSQMLLEVRDNGQGFPEDVLVQLREGIEHISRDLSHDLQATGHLGMLNTCWRLLHYSRGCPISMQVMNDNGAVVRLRIPLRQAK